MRLRHLLLLFVAWMAFDLAVPAMPGPFTLDLEDEPEVVHLRRAGLEAPPPAPAPDPARALPAVARPLAARRRARADALHRVVLARAVPAAPAHPATRAASPPTAEDH